MSRRFLFEGYLCSWLEKLFVNKNARMSSSEQMLAVTYGIMIMVALW